MEQSGEKPAVEKCKTELEEIAEEKGVPNEETKVAFEWCKRGEWYDDEIAEKLIIPLFLRK